MVNRMCVDVLAFDGFVGGHWCSTDAFDFVPSFHRDPVSA